MKAKLTKEDFIERATTVHGTKYDYTPVNYINYRTEVKIKCRQCGRTFEQTPSDHIQGYGCPNCAKKVRAQKNRMTAEEFAEKARQIHGDKYNYDAVIYPRNNKEKVKILCNVCGNMFEQSPHNHLCGAGCPVCGAKARRASVTCSKDDFIAKAQKAHGDRFDYSLVEYVNARTKVKIICKTCGNTFEQIASDHCRGNGCPHCSKMGISLIDSTI